MSDHIQGWLDTLELRRTAEVYAQGADRKDKQAWQSILSTDIVIEGPGFRNQGLEVNLASLDTLGEMFRATTHRVCNQLVDVDGDTATGETYGIAEHLLNETDAILIWSIRYQDRWQREMGSWRFVHRKLMVDWQETRPVALLER